MDTLTHTTMGLGLACLAHLDPHVSTSSEMALTVTFATVIGSNAPDFDIVYKIKGNSAYYRNHRGSSHSIFVIPLWAFAITGILTSFSPSINTVHLFTWTLLAVILHVFFDLFNVYGTQAARPFSKKWISFNCIPLFDPFIFVLHIIGFALLFVGFHPEYTFSVVYLMIFGYLLERLSSYNRTLAWLKNEVNLDGKYTLIPTVRWWKWDVIVDTENMIYTGTINYKKVEWHDAFSKQMKNENLIENASKDQKVQDYLASTDYAYTQVTEKDYGYEVRWFDLRFRNKQTYPYIAVVSLNQEGNILSSYTGWIYENKTLYKKLQLSNHQKMLPS
jgi:inner membrane protein